MALVLSQENIPRLQAILEAGYSLPYLYVTVSAKTCVFFLVTCIILQSIFKFHFSQYALLYGQVGFLLRQLHIMNCWSCFMIQVLIQNLPEVKLLIKHLYRSDIALVVSQPFKKRIVENKL